MVTWKAAYRRLSETRRFASYFARGGKVPKAHDFILKAYTVPFENVQAAEEAGTPGAPQGPLTQTFSLGAVILGVTSAAFVPQQAVAAADYAPSFNPGRRDTFVAFLQYTDDEAITSAQTVLTPAGVTLNNQARVMGEALTGSGFENEFPIELMLAPSQGISVAVASLLATVSQTVHIVFHAMVPRGG